VRFVPIPFSNLLTVFAAMPARFPKSRTPQPSAALAIRTCDRVINAAILRKKRLQNTRFFVHCTKAMDPMSTLKLTSQRETLTRLSKSRLHHFHRKQGAITTA
jgi:hypothetical protein